jgi:hypothetical protein
MKKSQHGFFLFEISDGRIAVTEDFKDVFECKHEQVPYSFTVVKTFRGNRLKRAFV